MYSRKFSPAKFSRIKYFCVSEVSLYLIKQWKHFRCMLHSRKLISAKSSTFLYLGKFIRNFICLAKVSSIKVCKWMYPLRIVNLNVIWFHHEAILFGFHRYWWKKRHHWIRKASVGLPMITIFFRISHRVNRALRLKVVVTRTLQQVSFLLLRKEKTTRSLNNRSCINPSESKPTTVQRFFPEYPLESLLGSTAINKSLAALYTMKIKHLTTMKDTVNTDFFSQCFCCKIPRGFYFVAMVSGNMPAWMSQIYLLACNWSIYF